MGHLNRAHTGIEQPSRLLTYPLPPGPFRRTGPTTIAIAHTTSTTGSTYLRRSPESITKDLRQTLTQKGV